MVQVFNIGDSAARVIIGKCNKLIRNCDSNILKNTLLDEQGPKYTDYEMRKFGLERANKIPKTIVLAFVKKEYLKDAKDVGSYVSVEYYGEGYSGSIACKYAYQMDDAINAIKADIIKEGDIPVVKFDEMNKFKEFLKIEREEP